MTREEAKAIISTLPDDEILELCALIEAMVPAPRPPPVRP